ncbi:MAG: hypothetical protein PHQ05_10070 [Sterolibacterium sp.]|nr:hypothetical protein [Sterolibacterium sp.]
MSKVNSTGMNDQNKAPGLQPGAAPNFTDCPFWGQGGQYIYDPVTKTRTKVSPTVAPADGIEKTPVAGDTLPADQTPAADAQTGAASSNFTKGKING